MSISVLKPGLLTSVQDLGRYGYQHLGVPAGGAMDSRAHRLANLLVGNTEDEATLEITLNGPRLRFDRACCIAVSGALLSPSLNGREIPNNRPLIVRPGDTLAFGARKAGLRAYLAVHGGFDVPVVMDSRSTFLRGGFGGLQGRALRKGDHIGLGRPLVDAGLDALSDELWKVKIYLPAMLGFVPRNEIRIIPGPDDELFTEFALQQLFTADFTVDPRSERMGYRLDGPRLHLRETAQRVSEVTSFGTIQVPPDGSPIVLMADRQTTGGYAKIAHVIAVDLPLIAQIMPGEALRFQATTLAHAQQLDGQREEAFGRLFQGLAPLRDMIAREGANAAPAA